MLMLKNKRKKKKNLTTKSKILLSIKRNSRKSKLKLYPKNLLNRNRPLNQNKKSLPKLLKTSKVNLHKGLSQFTELRRNLTTRRKKNRNPKSHPNKHHNPWLKRR